MKINDKNQRDYKINDDLSYGTNDNVRIIGEDIESKVVTYADAVELASSMEKDLIEINSSINPPILRIDNYDKFIYHQKKLQKKNKTNNKPIKEIDLKVNIAPNDLDTKVRKAKEFIEDGSKVKVVLSMKGRELSRRNDSKKCLFDFITKLENVAIPESTPKDEGTKTIVIFKKK